jgi:hypothetical protein
MQKPFKNISDNDTVEDDLGLIDLDHSDYGFILDGDGDLKAVLLPEDCTNVPEKVLKLLKVFGINDIDDISAAGHSIH